MSESRKTPSAKLDTTTSMTTNSTHENSLIHNNDISRDDDDDDDGNISINESLEVSDPRSPPMEFSATRPNRERTEEQAFDCRPMSPPKRISSSSELHHSAPSSSSKKQNRTNKGTSQMKEKSAFSPQMKTTNNNGTTEGRKTTQGQTLNLMEASLNLSGRAITRRLDNSISKERQRKTIASLKTKKKIRAERKIEKTHVTTRAASSSHAGSTSHDRNNIDDNDGINDEAVNENYYDVDGDVSLSPAPAPPSLRVRGHYSLRPGAYRMSTGGVARYVSASSDDIDNYSNHFHASEFDNAVDTVAMDASLVQDESSLPSPPLYRPTISEGYTVFEQRRYEYDRTRNHNISENIERHRDGCMTSTDHSIGGITSTAPTSTTFRSRTTAATEDISSFDKDDTGEIKFSYEKIFLNKRNMVVICFVVLSIIIFASIGAAHTVRGLGRKKSQPPSPPPSNPPSTSSSVVALKSLIKVLPEHTKKSLKIGSSPQSNAINWMVTYDDIESYALPRQLQRFALISLYFSIKNNVPSHEDLKSKAGVDECSWYDSTCVDNVYTELSLKSFDTLRGTIIPELALLSSLERLRIDQNALVGVIPTEIGQITTLKEISISGNLFRGTIPTEFGKLSKLEEIDLCDNLLSGSIPTEIGSWNKVQTLMLGNNNLSGTIPSEIGQMSNLVSISASSNKLEGQLPSEVGRLKRIKRFNVEKNYLDGEFVSKFENLGKTLENLQLRSNEFSGTLSSTISLLTNLVEFDISRNGLKGALPAEVGLMASLTRLQLYSNSFDNTIPTELGLLSNLESIALYYNLFSGTVPLEICELTFAHVLMQEDFTVDCTHLFCMCCSCPPK